LNLGFIVYLGCYTLFYILLGIFNFSIEWDYIIGGVMASMIYMIGFKAYNQPELFKEREKLIAEHRKEVQALIKPQKKNYYSKMLQQIMEQDKPYLNDQFKMVDLADQMGLSTHQVSYLLNHFLNTNFAEYINGFRVETAKTLLQNPEKDHLKILSIGYEAGFKSKTSFYHTFKKYTGMTPTEFRNQNKSSQPVEVA